MNIMKLSILAAAVAFAGAAHADTLQLQRSSGDLIPSSLVMAKSAPAAIAGETEAVHFAWALDAEEALSPAQPYQAVSREFWTQFDAAKARSGWGFVPTADGALVRISLQDQRKSRGLQVSDIQLRVDGQVLDSKSLIQHVAGTEELKSTGAQFSDGTLVFQLAPGLVGKRIDVAMPKAASGALMHVLEPNSPVTMELTADAVQAMPGQLVTLKAQFNQAKRARSANKVTGLITAPNGRSFDIEFRVDKSGQATAIFEIPADAGGGLEPWEVHAFGATEYAKNPVLRDVRTGLMVSTPTARLSGEATLQRHGASVVFEIPVETAVSGRFELRGTLHGTDADGVLRPMAIAHGAEVLSAGHGVLELRFPADVMNPALSAPYALRDLNLSDQSRMSLSEQRRNALDIPALP